MPIRFREGKVIHEDVGTQVIGSLNIMNDAVGSQHLANNAVSYAAQIKDGIVGYAELTAGLQGSLGGAPGPDTIGTTQLKEPGVGSENIYSNAVYGAKIKNNSVGSQQLADSGVTKNKILAGAIREAHLGTAIVHYANIGTRVIRSVNIGNNQVGSQELANVGVIASKIATGAAGSQKIANAAIYSTKIAANAVGYGKLTTGLQGSVNAGSVPAENSIGTTQIKKPGVGSENIYSRAVGTYSNSVRAIADPLSDILGMDFSTDKNRLWCVDVGNYIFEVGTANGDIYGSIRPIGSAVGVAYAADTNRLWLTRSDKNWFYECGTTGNVIGSLHSPGSLMTGIAIDDQNRLWIKARKFLTYYIFEVGTRTGAVLGSFQPPANSAYLAISRDRHNLLVDIAGGKAYEIGTTTGNIIGSFGIPTTGPTGITHDSDAKKHAWLFDNSNNLIVEVGTVSRYSHIRDNAIYYKSIKDDSVGSQHLANNAVSYAAQIKDGVVGYAELTAGLQGSLGGAPGPDTIGTTQLKEPGVGSENIYNGAVYGTKIKNNAVGSQQLANSGVISTKIANDAVGSQHIANDAIGSSAMVGAGIVLGYNLANNTIGSQQLADSSVINVKIANDSVGSQHMANDAIGSSAMVGAQAILGYNLKNNTIGSQQLANSAVITSKIPNATVTEAQFKQHFECGRVGTLTYGGKYITFTTSFTNNPIVVAVGQAIAAGVLVGDLEINANPVRGSFRMSKVTAGTIKAYWMAWGSR